jgi:hypothetical protein
MTTAVVAHDAGGAEILSSLLRRQGDGWRAGHVLALDGPARRIFERKLGKIESVGLEAAIGQASWLLCGTGWQSDLEVRAIALARHLGKRSVAFLDHWVNYRERFVRNGQLELPDEIRVGDDFAFERARAAFPQLPVVQVENPYFLDLREQFAKQAAPAAHDGLSFLYVCEPVREPALRQFGNERHWGYTEEEALRYFLDHVHLFGQPVGQIVIRPHPAEPAGKYDAIAREYDLPLSFSDGRELAAEIGDSDWVAGCNSMAMVMGLLAGRQVVCCIPPGGPACVLPHTEIRSLQAMAAGAAR